MEKHLQWQALLTPDIRRRGVAPDDDHDLRPEAIVAGALTCLDVAGEAWTRGNGTTPLEDLVLAAVAAVRGSAAATEEGVAAARLRKTSEGKAVPPDLRVHLSMAKACRIRQPTDTETRISSAKRGSSSSRAEVWLPSDFDDCLGRSSELFAQPLEGRSVTSGGSSMTSIVNGPAWPEAVKTCRPWPVPEGCGTCEAMPWWPDPCGVNRRDVLPVRVMVVPGGEARRTRGVAGRLVGTLTDRFTGWQVSAGLAALTVVGVLVVAVFAGPIPIVVGTALTVCGFAGAQAVLVSLAPDLVATGDRDIAQGLLNFMNIAGGGIGPAAVAGLSGIVPVPVALAVLAALPLAGLVLSLTWRPVAGRRPEPDATRGSPR
ncbi:hypothetical protein [[Actinomadura] parvosata]|uniref:hypothetical protein n=1 Tax=[Actinomadura] parvosata TaxID=1955412 RepID=UPI001C911C2B